MAGSPRRLSALVSQLEERLDGANRRAVELEQAVETERRARLKERLVMGRAAFASSEYGNEADVEPEGGWAAAPVVAVDLSCADNNVEGGSEPGCLCCCPCCCAPASKVDLW